MRQHWRKAAAFGFLVLLGLWVGGIIRTLTLPAPEPPAWHVALSEEYTSRLPLANNMKQLGLAEAPLPSVLDQPEIERIRVYEKGAQLAVSTAAFDSDETLLRSALAAHQAIVFNEKNSGIAPQRQLRLEIGVPPDKFDALVDQVRHIARLESVTVQQRDRTGEFRRLHAQRQSLKKHLDAVIKLRGAKNPTIDDALKLEQKVQDIEKELQALGVQLGDFLGKESFYHVHATLSEYQPGSGLDRTYTLPLRLADGLFWALGWWLAVALAIGGLAASYLSIQVLRSQPVGRGPEGPREPPAT